MLMGVRGLVSRFVLAVSCVVLCGLFGVGAVAQAASPAVVKAAWASGVESDYVTLEGEVEPAGTETTYRFEYGTSTAYGSSVPVPDGDIGSGEAVVTVSQQITGLSADTTYHYRLVATRGTETEDGSDQTFTTFALVSDSLPDGREYELVSPPDKNGGTVDEGIAYGQVEVPLEASEDGTAVTYASSSGFEDSGEVAKANVYLSNYLSRRGPSGWSTQDITLPVETKGPRLPLGSIDNTYEAMAPDLSVGFALSDSQLLPGSFPGCMMPYRRDNTTGATQALSPVSCAGYGVGGASYEVSEFAGATNDFSHIVFSTNAPLTESAGHEPGIDGNLYEWAGGQLRLVDILPDGQVPAPGAEVTFGSGPPQLEPEEVEFSSDQNVNHVISADGSRVFWTDETEDALYARVNGTSTILLSGSEKTNGTGPGGTDPMGAQLPVYQGASTDGSKVFFTSKAELTNDANTGDPATCGDCGTDLYMYDFDKPEGERLTDLTADPSGPTGAQVTGVAGMSEDGSYVYFTANGVLGSDTTSKERCGTESSCIYVWHEGTGTRAVAAGGGSVFIHYYQGHVEKEVSEYLKDSVASADPQERASRVSSNGLFFAFEVESQGSGEVYLYSAGDNLVVCASCNPTGARATGSSEVPYRPGGFTNAALTAATTEDGGWETQFYQQRYLTDEGRLFFDSSEALSPRDTNGQIDVYEYEPPGVGDCTVSSPAFTEVTHGCVSLISGGFSSEPSAFIDASANGNDVFFVTRDQLVPADRDQAVDLYDARVGGIASLAEPPPCESSDACKPGPTPQPTMFGAPASATFSGAGNIAPNVQAKTVKKKGAKKHRKGKPRPKSRRKAKRSRRRSGKGGKR
jgi:hypothetical protein